METFEYKSKAPLEIQIKKIGHLHYRILAIKDLNGLKPFEIANDINYCFQDEKMNFQKAIEDITIQLFKTFKIEIDNKNDEKEIESAFTELNDLGRTIFIQDMNPSKLICDENNIITMHCDIKIEKL